MSTLMSDDFEELEEEDAEKRFLHWTRLRLKLTNLNSLRPI